MNFTFAHKFCDNIDGLLRHDGIERHQFVVSQFLHDLSLLQKSLWGHCPRLQGLNSHLCGSVPCAYARQRENTLMETNQRHTRRTAGPLLRQSLWKASIHHAGELIAKFLCVKRALGEIRNTAAA